MSTETTIRRRWQQSQFWSCYERTDDEGDPVVEVNGELNGRADAIFKIAGDLDKREIAFFKLAAQAPEDIHRLLSVIDGLRSRIKDLERGLPPEETTQGDFWISLTDHDMRRAELLYKTGQLTHELRQLKEEGVPPTEWPEIDECISDFVAEQLEVTWDLRDEKDPTPPPLIQSA